MIRPIGFIRSCFQEKFSTPRQPGLCPDAWGEIVFEPDFRSPDALRGIEGFSHLWLVFGFHDTIDHGWHHTVRPPRLGGNERVGVFASRSTFRPNGLGLSLVRLEAIRMDPALGPILELGGIDIIDGTPIYDIKPYLPYAESIPDARAGFADGDIPRLTIDIDPSATDAFARLTNREQSVIRQALSLDPRPAASPTDPARIYGVHMCGKNVRFTIRDEVCLIIQITDSISRDCSGGL
jgi:tRNA-Thr(GGU) m(6)t(6)A37 methyltransferase TsaA